MASMRVWFAILMIALLPLRVAAADLMALGLLAPAGQMPASAVMSPMSPMSDVQADLAPDVQDLQDPQDAHADCHGHVSASAAAPADGSPVHGACVSNCPACQVCHSAALAPVMAAPRLASTPAAPPAQDAFTYSSASIARGLKPPIS